MDVHAPRRPKRKSTVLCYRQLPVVIESSVWAAIPPHITPRLSNNRSIAWNAAVLDESRGALVHKEIIIGNPAESAMVPTENQIRHEVQPHFSEV
jgi:hypothetical protein